MSLDRMDNGALQAVEAERAIVAALFAPGAAEAFDRLELMLKPEDFFVSAHGAVFEAFGRLVLEGNKCPDPAVISNKVKSLVPVTDEIKRVLQDALVFPFHPENIEEYGRAVVEKARARKISGELQRLAAQAGKVGGDLTSDDLLRDVEAFASGFESGASSDIQLLDSASKALSATLEHIEAVSEGKIVGVMSGLTDLDEATGGAAGGDLVVVGARPSMGKTAFGLTWALNYGEEQLAKAAEAQELVVIFSLEMPTVGIVQRCLAGLGRIDHNRLRNAKLTDDDYSRLAMAVSKYDQIDVRIDTDPQLTPATMRHKLRLLKKQTGKKVGLVVVDYLSLMESDRLYANNKASEVGEVSKQLKRIAKEEDAPVIALAQLNRKVEERADKRPNMADLRESGSIEQDADTILLLYRDEYYNPDSPDKGFAEVIVAKARNGGQVGTVRAAFRGEYVRFENPLSYSSF